jgi:hypothetical protein
MVAIQPIACTIFFLYVYENVKLQVVTFGAHIPQWAKIVSYWQQKQFVNVYICSNIDSGQEVEKIMRTFLWSRNEAFN